MSQSIMKMADEILDGMLTSSTPTKISVSRQAALDEEPLPDISDEVRASFLSESMKSSAMAEKLGPELKPHAKHGERSYSPSTTQKHTSVDVPDDAKKKLSPGAQQKLTRHKQRSASRDDEKTSWAVDRAQSHQKASWGREGERQRKHQASRGTSTRGAKPSQGTTKVMGHDKPNTDISTAWGRSQKLSPDKQAKIASKGPEHAATRRVKSQQQDKADLATWRRTNPSMKAMRDKKAARLKTQRASATASGDPKPKTPFSAEHAERRKKQISSQNASKTYSAMTLVDSIGQRPPVSPGSSQRPQRGDASRPGTPAGKRHQQRIKDKNSPENVAARKKIASLGGVNASMSRKQQHTLVEARNILREASTAGGIGTTGMGGSSNRAYHMQRHQNDNAWTPDIPIAPVDKSLSKVGDKKITKKKVAKALKDRLKKKNEAPTEAFEKFLELVLSDIQIEDKKLPWLKNDKEEDPKAFGGKKRDKSKTHRGEDFEDEEGDEEEFKDEKMGKKNKKSKKNMRKVYKK